MSNEPTGTVAVVKEALKKSKNSDDVFMILPNGKPSRVSYVEVNPRTGAVYIFTEDFVRKVTRKS